MLGEKIYTLRKNKNISQEEFANILNTSRQAVSKWERNESKPDIDKLISIAKLFNVSIDYLLSYEINYSNVDAFINELEDCYLNNNLTININDIRLWCSKYTNNFKLHVYSADYLFVSFLENKNDGYLNLALYCINKAISMFKPEDNNIISLNDLHMSVSNVYFMQQKYELAKEYIKKNNVYGYDVLLAKCELALKNYDSALKIASEIYLKSASNIINVSLIQIMVLLKSKKVREAYDLVDWTILFLNSITNNDDFFEGIRYPFVFLKPVCEQLLNMNSKETINMLKDINANAMNLNRISKSTSIKYYFGESSQILLCASTIKDTIKEIIHQTSKDDFHYQTLINIYNEIFGGDINE